MQTQSNTLQVNKSGISAGRSGRFKKYQEAGFLGHVIPIIPPNARLSETSKVDPSQCGKIPGSYQRHQDAWVGLANWATKTFTPADIERWDSWPRCNVGIRTEHNPAIDTDCEVGLVVELLEKLNAEKLGATSVRRREGSERVLQPYRLKEGETPAAKKRISFTLENDPEEYAVELLGAGQQFVAEGIHPSGKPYVWDKNWDLTLVTRAGLPEITTQQWHEHAALIEEYLRKMGATIITKYSGGSLTAKRLDIGHETHLAKDFEKLTKALNAIPCDSLSYDEWMAILHAIKAACGDDHEFFVDVVLPWALRYQENTPEVVQAKWLSITTSTIGADYIYAKAREHGFNEVETDFDDLPPLDEITLAEELPIRFNPGDYAKVAQEAERRLLSKKVPFFCYSDRIVEIAKKNRRGVRCDETAITVLEPINIAALLNIYSTHLRFEKWDRRKNNWMPTNCPREVAEQYLNRPSEWRVPTLSGIINVPTLRPDGTILNQPGFDEATGLLYIPDGTALPAIPEHPSKDEAKSALAILKDELLADFPFTTPADRSVALSFLLSSCARWCFAHAPMHCFSAPVAGSGKGKLVNVAAVISDGLPAAAMDFSSDTEELRKNIEASLMQGISTFNLDNVDAPLGGRRICSLITEDSVRARILGQSKVLEIRSSILFSANGNNLRLKGDMRRRAILCYIDPKRADPENRDFTFDPVERARTNQGRYVVAVLTVLLAYIQAGYPINVPKYGSFEEWGKLVRGALIWLGETDPVETVESIKVDEPEADALATIHEAWEAAIGLDEAITVRALIEKAEKGKEFTPLGDEPSPAARLSDALLTVASNGQGHISHVKLGYWLRANKNTMSRNLRIVSSGMRDGNRQWKLQKLDVQGKQKTADLVASELDS
jgi:hypothetical protein